MQGSDISRQYYSQRGQDLDEGGDWQKKSEAYSEVADQRYIDASDLCVRTFKCLLTSTTKEMS